RWRRWHVIGDPRLRSIAEERLERRRRPRRKLLPHAGELRHLLGTVDAASQVPREEIVLRTGQLVVDIRDDRFVAVWIRTGCAHHPTPLARRSFPARAVILKALGTTGSSPCSGDSR